MELSCEALPDPTLCQLSASALRQAFLDRSLGPVEVTNAYLDRIDRLNPQLGAYLLVTRRRALGDAEESEMRYAAKASLGPLDGVPLGLKDLIDTAGIETTYGSRIHRGRIPAGSAAVARSLQAAGTVLLGKLHLLEFAMGGVTDNAYFGTCQNPWSPDHFSGGSSTGSGVAVAAGLAALALGTDTSGSIRQPAAWCNVVGLKPTNGLIDLSGIFSLSPTCDTVGPLTRTVADCANLLAGMSGDWSTYPQAGRAGPLVGIKLGLPIDLGPDAMTDSVRVCLDRSVEALTDLGAQIKPIALDFGSERAVTAAYQAITLSECAVAHAAWYPHRRFDYAPYMRDNITRGLAVDSNQKTAAMAQRATWARMADRALCGLDAIITPTMPTPAPAFANDHVEIAGREISSLQIRGRFTMPWSVIGWPALSIPAGFTDDQLPVGLQIAGRPQSEPRLLQIGAAHESATPWVDHRADP